MSNKLHEGDKAMTGGKYLITYRDENGTDRQIQFTDWNEAAFFVRLLDERGLSHKVYEKQQNVRYTDGHWVEIDCNEEKPNDGN